MRTTPIFFYLFKVSFTSLTSLQNIEITGDEKATPC